LIENVITTYKASGSIQLLDPDITTILLRYIDPNAGYKTKFKSEEDICPDYVHPLLMDEVKAATTIAACAATKNDILLLYGDDVMDGPMGPYIQTDL
jgi:hypothetical protein